MRGVPAELVQEFDPIHNLPEEPPEVVEGRRTLELKFNRFGGLNPSLTRSTAALRRGFDRGSSWRSPRGFSSKTLKMEV